MGILRRVVLISQNHIKLNQCIPGAIKICLCEISYVEEGSHHPFLMPFLKQEFNKNYLAQTTSA